MTAESVQGRGKQVGDQQVGDQQVGDQQVKLDCHGTETINMHCGTSVHQNCKRLLTAGSVCYVHRSPASRFHLSVTCMLTSNMLPLEVVERM